MLATKLFLGFGIIVLGTITFNYPFHQEKYIDNLGGPLSRY